MVLTQPECLLLFVVPNPPRTFTAFPESNTSLSVKLDYDNSPQSGVNCWFILTTEPVSRKREVLCNRSSVQLDNLNSSTKYQVIVKTLTGYPGQLLTESRVKMTNSWTCEFSSHKFINTLIFTPSCHPHLQHSY